MKARSRAGDWVDLPTDSTPVPLTLKLETVFDEAAADDVAARADLVKSNAELEAEIKKQGAKAKPELLAAEKKIKEALLAPWLGAAAHAEDMLQIGKLIADSAASAQTATLALGAQGLIVGDLEVLGGETVSIASDASGDSTGDLLRFLVRLPAEAEPMLLGFDEMVDCVGTLGTAGEISGKLGVSGGLLAKNLTTAVNLDVDGQL
ncbi:MAG: hypothetical protein ACI9OJ_000733 [Myxococcota bacterium]|jgi:hypothetical protein